MEGGTHRQEGRRGGRDGGRRGSWPHVSHAQAEAAESEDVAERWCSWVRLGAYGCLWWASGGRLRRAVGGTATANGCALTAFDVLLVHGSQRAAETVAPGRRRRRHRCSKACVALCGLGRATKTGGLRARWERMDG